RVVRKAYALTASHDAAIALGFAKDERVVFPETLVGAARLVEQTRYGENPHQKAALYRNDEQRPGVATARQVQGKELSYNNYADTDAAYELVAEFAGPAIAIIKHANPCGAATGASPRAAWDKALRCDPVSAFGGIVALNRPLDAATAEAVATVGIGAGQMSRADSVHIAARKAADTARAAGLPEPLTRGSVVASDAFYPFPDALEAAIAAGATAAIQPGGSRRDAEAIAAADRAGMAMVLTGIRHFRH